MKKVFLTGITALFLATGTAHAMQHDMSNTWCAKNIPKRAMVDREHYYAWIEKCHARRGTKPRWGHHHKVNDDLSTEKAISNRYRCAVPGNGDSECA